MAAREPPTFLARPDYWLRHLQVYYRRVYPEGYTPYVFAGGAAAPDAFMRSDEFTYYIVAPLSHIGALSWFGTDLKSVALHDAEEDIDDAEEDTDNVGRIFVAECTGLCLLMLLYSHARSNTPHSQFIICLPDDVDAAAARGAHLVTLDSRLHPLLAFLDGVVSSVAAGEYVDAAYRLMALLRESGAGRKDAAAKLAAALTKCE